MLIEDSRFMRFGLADKYQFTEEEYKELKEKYPDFDEFWLNTWLPYFQLRTNPVIPFDEELKAELEANLQQKTELLNELNNQLEVLENSEQLDSNLLISRMLLKLEKNRLEEDIDKLNKELMKIDSEKEIKEKEIADYKMQLMELEQKIDEYLEKYGGFNPLKT